MTLLNIIVNATGEDVIGQDTIGVADSIWEYNQPVDKKPVLKYPTKESFSVSVKFWVDFTGDPNKGNFYSVFDNHHPGIDIWLTEGSPIYASYAGVVVRNEFHRGMGNVIGIRNGNIVSLYAHLSKSMVNIGEEIKQKKQIGLSGMTGTAMATKPHLHFELRDLTKPNLKEMVFEPEFGVPIGQWRNIFTYIVNNQNTEKTLRSLSLLYFGSDEKWKLIQELNPSLKVNALGVIEEKSGVLIPNYR